MSKDTRRSVLQKIGSTAALGSLMAVGAESAAANYPHTVTVTNEGYGQRNFEMYLDQSGATVKSTSEPKNDNLKSKVLNDKMYGTLPEGTSATFEFKGEITSFLHYGDVSYNIRANGTSTGVWEVDGGNNVGAYTIEFSEELKSVSNVEYTESTNDTTLNGNLNGSDDVDVVTGEGNVSYFASNGIATGYISATKK